MKDDSNQKRNGFTVTDKREKRETAASLIRETDIGEEGFPMAPRVVVIQNAYVRAADMQEMSTAFVVFTVTGLDVTTLEDGDDAVNLALTGMMKYEQAMALSSALKANALKIPIEKR